MTKLEHVCGLQGFDPMRGDRCLACEADRMDTGVEEPYEAELPAELTAVNGPSMDEWRSQLWRAVKRFVEDSGGDPAAASDEQMAAFIADAERSVRAAMTMALRYGWPRRPPDGWTTERTYDRLVEVRSHPYTRLRGHAVELWTRYKLPPAARDGLRPVWIGPPTPWKESDASDDEEPER